jgi:DNA-binding response OmpR family regulator
MSGETVLQQVRCRSGVPVLILSARGRVEERVRGLGLGADDYMTKPFSPLELIARVKALLRRAPSDAPESDLLIFDAGRLEIDTSRREVRVDGALCDVTRTEFDLLLALAEHPGDIQSRASLALALRGEGFDGDERFVDVHIRNLRRKVEDDPARPRRVETVRGGGYRIGLAPS